MKQNKLTAIIPCYNFEKYIEQAVESVIGQNTNFGIQIFLVDDHSTDGTYRLINEKYGRTENVTIFQSPKNQGITKNIKDMLDKVSSPYVFIMDGDDYIVDIGYLQRAVNFLDENSQYSLYCSGYRWLHNDGVMEPPDAIWASTIQNVTLDDLLNINHVSFGRVFRKYKNLVQPWMSDSFHEDWLINAEILKHGPARCEKEFVGIYRITKSGRITSLTEEQIQEKNRQTINNIKAHLYTKTISIVDSFVHNDKVRVKLENTVKWLKEDGHDTLLISNTPVDKEIIKNVKYYIYDSRNQLFQQKYTNVSWVDFWKTLDSLDTMAHDVVSGIQKHGLSVLINLFNALIYAKEQGYTHFQRFEVDDIYGEISRKHILSIPHRLQQENKKGLFYYNYHNSPNDVSFHYYYCEIDTFLQKIRRITCEDDYIKYLDEYYGNKDFKNVEIFIHDHLKRVGDGDILKKDYKQMLVDFPDTFWNTETSISNYETKYSNCTTKIYNVRDVDKATGNIQNKPDYLVLTYLFVDSPVTRKIVVERKNGETYEFEHAVIEAGGWAWHMTPADTVAISVYQDGKFLYREDTRDIVCYVEFKK